MKSYFNLLCKSFLGLIFLLNSHFLFAQNSQALSVRDFAIWGGSANAGQFNANQGVIIRSSGIIQGNIGSNHFVDLLNNVNLTGNIFSGNGINIGVNGQITGNLVALKMSPAFMDTAIFASVRTNIFGNLTANGKIIIPNVKSKLSSISGTVSVPSPSNNNYSGPIPGGGTNNTLILPSLPAMPGITPFDNLTGTVNVTTTRVLAPGVYRNMELRGNQTITFNGPGNYVFDEIFNNGSNNIIFDLKNTTEGTINLFIKNEAQMGRITVRAVNGDFASRIFTEVHGDGTKRRVQNDGVSFEIQAPGAYPEGRFLWLGNVWAANGGILIRGTKRSTRPHIMGALWSATKVDIKEIITLSYSAPAATSVSFIEPYYAPPAQGKIKDEENIIGAELTSLANNPVPILNIPKNEVYIFNDDGRVGIEVVSKDPNDITLKNELIALGMTDIIDNGPHIYKITGYFPVSKLNQLNSNPRVEFVHPWYPPINNSGQVTTRGDSTMRTNLVRNQFGLDGSGIKIGVVSDSYNSKLSAQDDVDQGDLPGVKSNGQPNENSEGVQVLKDLAQRGIDEGRAMLQIVHDIAPKAKLAFRTGYLSAGDFATGILELADPNLEGGRCDIIVDDLSYITEPFFKDGVVAKAVDQVVAQGVTYFTSAGNFGQKSYEGVFNGVSNPAVVPAPAQVHKFGAADNEIYQSIRLNPGTYTIVLQWDDDSHSLGDANGVKTDMDLYLVDGNNFTLFGFNRSNLFKDPFEVCPFKVDDTTIAKVMIVRAAGTENVRFKYVIFRGDATILDYNSNTSTIVGHANSNGAISVGAMFYEPRPTIPIWPSVSSFSSRGGTFIKENNNFITRNKPDIIGPNGGNTTVNLGGSFFDDGDLLPNFFGTSAAAPHVAALGGLIMQARKKFNQQTIVSPDEIRQQLISSAGKFSYLTGTFSFEGGNGYAQGDEALMQIANARPIIDSLYSEVDGSENGEDPFIVVLKGRLLTPTTQIFVDGQPYPTTISEDGTEASATIPPIPNGTDPAFQLFNSAKSPSGEDGGFSEKKYFFSKRKEVIVQANNKVRKYGQENPFFDVEITLDGEPLSESGLTMTDLGLDGANLSISTIATSKSKAGNYGIFVARTTPLALNDPLNDRFNFIYRTGTLTIQKMPLTIVPQFKQIKYGEFPGSITYDYFFDLGGSEYEGFEGGEGEECDYCEEDPKVVELRAEISRLHKEYMAENGLIVIKDFQENGQLGNLSTLASLQSVLNARKFTFQDGKLVPLTGIVNAGDIGNQRFIVETPFSALSNYMVDQDDIVLSEVPDDNKEKGFLNLKDLSQGKATATLNGEKKFMINGQLMGMVNDSTEVAVNGQLRALVNGTDQDVSDIVFQNGQLRALVNGEWVVVPNGQLRALVNDVETDFELSVNNGQLRALVNGEEEMQLVNGQLRATVNGQDVSMVNGQLRATVNGQLVPMVNNELMAVVNGQLRAMVNGEMAALVNGQLMALVENNLEGAPGLTLEEVTELTLVNGQLRAMVNGQLRAMVNGQLKAMVNGELTDIDTDISNLTLVNGQLRAMVNGQLRALVNGQLKALVNGQLRALVNSEAIVIDEVTQLSNGQLKALVNGHNIPIKNGQLRAMINGQLRAMVNGEIMAKEDGQINFTVFENGQLKAMVNGQLRAVVNGQLRAMVNGELEGVNSYSIANGQLRAVVNSQEWVLPNGQLKALVNGQLQPLVNNFDVSGANNNAKTMVLVDKDDYLKQQGDIGGILSMAMITGLDVGFHKIIPAAFINENFEVNYDWEELEILPAPLFVKTFDTTKVYGEENPEFEYTITGGEYGEEITVKPSNEGDGPYVNADQFTSVGVYPIDFYLTLSDNYTLVNEKGNLTILPKLLTVKADDKELIFAEEFEIPALTINYDGLVGDDTEDSVCVTFLRPASPKVINDYDRTITYTNVLINGTSNVFFATPGQSLTLSGEFVSYNNPVMDCPGCITQIHIGMGNGVSNFFSTCYESTVSGTYHNIAQGFNAPTVPGVYYITQRGSWWFNCGQFEIDNHQVADISKFAIAVVIVNTPGGGSEDKISASTVDVSDITGPGEYPITLQGCANYNPNYNVVLVNGTLTVIEGILGGAVNENEQAVVVQKAKIDVKEPDVITKDKLYPNPASTTIRLELTEDVVSINEIQVLNSFGKLSSANARKIDKGVYELNVSSLSKGVYFVKTRTASGIKTFKFIKL